ncbi:hypothetical protein [Bacillus phage CP-51]|uniref:Uncharacterized protein n=1 Tax=Bacillus phage CP-51 TaxID=1391188 RepID=A0A068EUA7_9CAUD|nr:hypothetical protein OZ73_gp186 [Bacillus phage CP-51]AID50621.1 hypothetical protein [Bacillus phage CP-51]
MTQEQYLQSLLEKAETEEEVEIIKSILRSLECLSNARRGFGAY